MKRSTGLMLAFVLPLGACSAEERHAGPDQPQSAPRGPDDPRIAAIEASKQQVSQGGRYFAWYGCSSCHSGGATDALDLGDGRWRRGGGFDQVYRSIADGHPGRSPAYGASIPAQQLWQITAFARSLQKETSARRRRQDLDQVGEAQASSWAGPVR